MRKKGFTLVELLATIVVLSVIALIAVPIVINVIEKAKKSALVSSVNGLVESANMYYANQSIKGEHPTETIFDFVNGEQTSNQKLEYKGKVYNGKLILHANGEVAVCIDDKEHYAYKNKDSDEIVSGIGTCLYDGTTGDFSSNSSINDLRGKTVVATNITQSDDGLSTLITIPEEGHYDTNSNISVLNSNLGVKNILDNITFLTSNYKYDTSIGWDFTTGIITKNTDNIRLTLPAYGTYYYSKDKLPTSKVKKIIIIADITVNSSYASGVIGLSTNQQDVSDNWTLKSQLVPSTGNYTRDKTIILDCESITQDLYLVIGEYYCNGSFTIKRIYAEY